MPSVQLLSSWGVFFLVCFLFLIWEKVECDAVGYLSSWSQLQILPKCDSFFPSISLAEVGQLVLWSSSQRVQSQSSPPWVSVHVTKPFHPLSWTGICADKRSSQQQRFCKFGFRAWQSTGKCSESWRAQFLVLATAVLPCPAPWGALLFFGNQVRVHISMHCALAQELCKTFRVSFKDMWSPIWGSYLTQNRSVSPEHSSRHRCRLFH